MDGTRSVDGTRKPRKVILFSDGTGNSSGKLFKTNVWRLYEALNLGPTDGKDPEQVALYSNGVGTSSFRPLALIGGIFGYGLKANVLDLYKFLCRNWRPGDEIYVFGFSRGAFTIRLLAGLIASQGVLRGGAPDLPPDEDTLAYQARAAYRAFAGRTWPNRAPARVIARGVRALRNGILTLHRVALGRTKYDQARNCYTDIAFVGVWDTVAAYGGPIVEITRGIDDWMWPLTMPNYQLSPRVLKARHALALDDERDAFQPLLWDEVREEMLVKWGGFMPASLYDVREKAEKDRYRLTEEFRTVADGRLKQVWFSGMHADVGGGYPDESLSFISLLWMIDELDGALRLLPDHLDRIAGMANIYGPIHDSRSGMGGYYRFQPRRIAAQLDWRTAKATVEQRSDGSAQSPASGDTQPPAWFQATRSLRDPEIADRAFEIPKNASPEIAALAAHIRSDHGLLTGVRVHESAIARIVSGTDNYAPLALPDRFDVVFAGKTGRSAPLLDPMVARRIRDSRRDPAGAELWKRQDDRIGDMIWWRRLQYFTVVAISLLLASMPLLDVTWDERAGFVMCVDERCVARPVLRLADKVSGGYLGPWVDTIADHLLLVVVMILVLAAMVWLGSWYDLKLRSQTRRAWRAAITGDNSKAEETLPKRRGLAAIRESAGYQRVMTATKWKVMPAIFGGAMWLFGIFIAVALVMQLLVFPTVERKATFCETLPGESPTEANNFARLGIVEGRPARFGMTTDDRCARSGRMVEAGQDYTIRVTVVPEREGEAALWTDEGAPTTPEAGPGVDHNPFIEAIGVPFRRVTLLGWLKPITIVRSERGGGWLEDRIGPRADIDGLKLAVDPSGGGYVGRFRPRITGYLDMSVNDAVLPFAHDNRYGNNTGAAIVEVWAGGTATPTGAGGVPLCVNNGSGETCLGVSNQQGPAACQAALAAQRAAKKDGQPVEEEPLPPYCYHDGLWPQP